MIWNEELQKEIPEGFEIKSLGEIFDLNFGGDLGKETLNGNYTQKVYCVRGADIPDVKFGNIIKMPMRFILPKNLISKQLKHNDLVVEISGGSLTQSTGRILDISKEFLNRFDIPLICSNFCKVIRSKNIYNNIFIYYYWQYMYDKKVFFSYENGTTGIKNLDLASITKKEKIVIPPTTLKQYINFNIFCEKKNKIIFNNALQNQRLAELRDTLLPRLMSGELDVSALKYKI